MLRCDTFFLLRLTVISTLRTAGVYTGLLRQLPFPSFPFSVHTYLPVLRLLLSLFHHSLLMSDLAGSSARTDATPVIIPDVTKEVAVQIDEEESIDAKYKRRVDECVFHLYKPIDNLPPLISEELKVIGRCITLEADTMFRGEKRTMHYSGLVSSISFDSISLIHVQRFSEDTFAQFLENVKAASRRLSTATTEESSEAFRQDESSSIEVISKQQDVPRNNTFNVSYYGESSPVTSQPVNITLDSCEEDTIFPFVSFNRKCVHNVQFSIDPPSTFYSLFSVPERRRLDRQFFSMFIRRYLVHTCQGDNPTGIPIKPFVECRTNCTTIDDDLLVRTAQQDMIALLKLDAEIQRMTVQQRQSSHRREAVQAQLNMRLAVSRSARDTLLVATVELFFLCLLIICRWLWTEVYVLQPYLRKFSLCCLFVCFGTLVLGLATTIHGQSLRRFTRSPFLFLTRLILCATALYWIMIFTFCGAYYLSLPRLRSYMASVPNRQLQNLYNSYSCSGFDYPCTDTTNDQYATFCDIPFTTAPQPYACGPGLHGEIYRSIFPCIVVGLAIAAVVLFDIYLLFRTRRGSVYTQQ